jgi:DNA-binding response OmpR family regulator
MLPPRQQGAFRVMEQQGRRDLSASMDETAVEKSTSVVTILLIDDNEPVRTLFRTILEQAGYRVVIAASGNEGWRLLHDESVDLILAHVFLPDVDGLEFIHRLRKTRPDCKIIAMLGGSGEWGYLDTVKLLGANDVLGKPLSPKELLDTVSAQMKPARL